MIDLNTFASRHIGPRNEDIKLMLKSINCSSLDDLINKTVPSNILSESSLKLKPGMSEEFNKLNMQVLSIKNNFCAGTGWMGDLSSKNGGNCTVIR